MTVEAISNEPLINAPRAAGVPQRVRIGEVWIDAVTNAGALDAIDALVAARKPTLIMTPNLDHTVRATRSAEYREFLKQASLVVADGQPLIWASRLLGTPLPERVAGSDLLPAICERAAQRGHRVYLFGGNPGSAEAARDELIKRYPGVQIVGTDCPPMGFDKDPEQNAAAVAKVKAAQPDIVFVGLGSPKQERWITAHHDEYGPAVSLGIGVAFSFIAGDVKRAPRWLQKLGLEWLHRLLQEPGRLSKRYLVDSWSFLPIVWRTWRIPRTERVINAPSARSGSDPA